MQAEPQEMKELSLLDVSLTLTIDGKKHSVPCSQVKRVALDLRSWGFEAEVEFFSSPHRNEDALFVPWCKADLVEVALSLENARESDGAIAVQGIATHKEVAELTGEESLSGQPVLHRRYTLRFADPAQVLWRQHYLSLIHI